MKLCFIFLQFGAKQRNRDFKCSRNIINLQSRLNEWLVNSWNDTTISRCHCGETSANFSGAVFFFYRVPSEKPKVATRMVING